MFELPEATVQSSRSVTHFGNNHVPRPTSIRQFKQEGARIPTCQCSGTVRYVYLHSSVESWDTCMRKGRRTAHNRTALALIQVCIQQRDCTEIRKWYTVVPNAADPAIGDDCRCRFYSCSPTVIHRIRTLLAKLVRRPRSLLKVTSDSAGQPCFISILTLRPFISPPRVDAEEIGFFKNYSVQFDGNV